MVGLEEEVNSILEKGKRKVIDCNVLKKTVGLLRVMQIAFLFVYQTLIRSGGGKN